MCFFLKELREDPCGTVERIAVCAGGEGEGQGFLCVAFWFLCFVYLFGGLGEDKSQGRVHALEGFFPP